MSNINEDENFIINNDKKNKALIPLLFNENGPEPQTKFSDSINTLKGKIEKNINAQENNMSGNSFLNLFNNNINQINKNSNISGEKKPIFQVNTRNIHSGNDPDNVKTIIIKDFISLFISFINYSIRIINKNDNFEFHICYRLKSKIKLEDIIKDTVKKLLISFAYVKDKKNEDYDNNIDNKSNTNIIEIIKQMPSSLDILFNKQVLDIFKDIYAKEIHNETDKEIELKNYGLKGKVFILDESVPTYKKLREKYKNKRPKIFLMDQIVDSLKNPPKKQLFEVKKKK